MPTSIVHRCGRRDASEMGRYWEMLEILGGSESDGPPLQPWERFAAGMGVSRDPRTGAPVSPFTEDQESLLRRVLASHLAERPDLAAAVRKRSSARLQVRFPRTLYGEIIEAAASDGTSLNTFVVAACAAWLARRGRVRARDDSNAHAVDDRSIEAMMYD